MFHKIGAGVWESDGQVHVYGEFLKILYKIFGVSFWLGEVASVFTYSLCLLLFVELGLMLGVRERLVQCVLLFGLLPSPAIHCSVTFRESYQVLGLLGTLLALLKLRQGELFWPWPLLGISLVALVVMHQSMIFYAAILLFGGLPWALRGSGGVALILGGVLAIGSAFVLPKALDRVEKMSDGYRALERGNFLEYASKYREKVELARSDYGVKMSYDDPISFCVSALLIVFMYFVAPLPWQVSSVMDYYAFLEVAIRIMLFAGFYLQWRQADATVRERMTLMFGAALLLELMWSIGTTNWGTSLRHHVVAYGVFVLLGLPYFRLTKLDPDLSHLLERRARRKATAV